MRKFSSTLFVYVVLASYAVAGPYSLTARLGSSGSVPQSFTLPPTESGWDVSALEAAIESNAELRAQIMAGARIRVGVPKSMPEAERAVIQSEADRLRLKLGVKLPVDMEEIPDVLEPGVVNEADTIAAENGTEKTHPVRKALRALRERPFSMLKLSIGWPLRALGKGIVGAASLAVRAPRVVFVTLPVLWWQSRTLPTWEQFATGLNKIIAFTLSYILTRDKYLSAGINPGDSPEFKGAVASSAALDTYYGPGGPWDQKYAQAMEARFGRAFVGWYYYFQNFIIASWFRYLHWRAGASPEAPWTADFLVWLLGYPLVASHWFANGNSGLNYQHRTGRLDASVRNDRRQAKDLLFMIESTYGQLGVMGLMNIFWFAQRMYESQWDLERWFLPPPVMIYLTPERTGSASTEATTGETPPAWETAAAVPVFESQWAYDTYPELSARVMPYPGALANEPRKVRESYVRGPGGYFAYYAIVLPARELAKVPLVKPIAKAVRAGTNTVAWGVSAAFRTTGNCIKELAMAPLYVYRALRSTPPPQQPGQ